LIRAKQQLKQFIDEKMTDQDMAAVVTTSSSLGVLQQFMRDRKMLKYAIEKITLFARPSTFFTPYLAARVLETGFVPGAMTEPMQVAAAIMAKEEWGGTAPPPSIILGRAKQILEEESVMRRSTLLTIKGVSDRMADLPGQRMLAFVSDGFTMLGENGSAEHEDFNDATSRAVRSGVVIYSFSPRGLQAPAEFGANAPMSGFAFGNLMHDSELDQQQTLRDVAHVTGGEAYLNSNDVVGQFKKMLDANRVYYALAYYPQAGTDKKFRNIKLLVKNHPEYHIRTQSGYQPSNEKKSEVATTPQQKLFEAMVAPLPTTAISVTSAADYLERTGDDTQVTLVVHFDGQLLEYAQKDQKHLLACELAVVVFDHDGKPAQSFSETISAAFTAEQLEKAKHNGFRYVKRLKLAPDLYQVRIGVRDINGSLMGTSTSWTTVPDLQKHRLTLSSIFLGKDKQEDHASVIATADKTAKPALISGQASFKHTEPVFYRCVLYNSAAAGAVNDNLQVRVEILESGASAYDGSWQPLASKIIRSDGLGMEIGGQLKLEVPPGIYTLRITVRDQKSKKETQQTVSFEIDS
jgi:VWFA-related protein